MKQKVVIKKSKIANAGDGVYAQSLFRKGDRVCEYAGDIVDKEHTMDIYLMDRVRYLREIHPYARDLDEMHVIIGDRQLGLDPERCGVYVNDAGSLKDTSDASIAEYTATSVKCNVMPVPDADNKNIYYVATKRIKRGEEIYAHYGVHYWLLLNGVPAEKLLKMCF